MIAGAIPSDPSYDPQGAITEIIGRLRRLGPSGLDPTDIRQRHDAVSLTIEVSFAELTRRQGPTSVARLIDLAIFPEDTDIPIASVERWWRTEFGTETPRKDLWRDLANLSFLLRLDLVAGTARLHDVMRGYLRHRDDADLVGRNGTFIDSFRPSVGWAALPEADRYGWRHAGWHLAEAKRHDELVEAASDLSYLAGKALLAGAAAAELELDEAARHDPRLTNRANAFVRNAYSVTGLTKRTAIERTLAVRMRIGGAALGPLQPRRLPDEPDEALIRTLEGHTGWVWAVAVAADGTIITGSGDQTVRLWNPDTGTPSAPSKATPAGSGRWRSPPTAPSSPASDDQTVRLWNPDTGDTIRTLTGHTGGVRAVAVAADGTIITGSDDQTVRLWNPDTGDTIRTLEGHTGGVRAVAVAADGTIVTASDDDRTTLEPRHRRHHPHPRRPHQRGHGGGGGRRRHHHHRQRRPDGATVEPRHRRHHPHPHRPHRLGHGGGGGRRRHHHHRKQRPDGRLWNPDTGEHLRTLTGHTSGVTAVAVAADGTIITGSGDQTVRLWNPDTGDTIRTLEGHTGGVRAVAVAADGTIITGSGDQTVRLWNPDTGDTIRTLEGHTGGVRAVAVAADGTIITGSDDRTVRLWNPGTGEEVAGLGLHGIATSVAVHANGLIYVGGAAGLYCFDYVRPDDG